MSNDFTDARLSLTDDRGKVNWDKLLKLVKEYERLHERARRWENPPLVFSDCAHDLARAFCAFIREGQIRFLTDPKAKTRVPKPPPRSSQRRNRRKER